MITLILIVVVFCGIICLLNLAYKRTNAYFNQFYLNWDFTEEKIERIVILGSTYSRYAFESFKYLRIAHNNLTLKHQSVEESYKNLKKIEYKLNHNLVFLMLAPCTLLYEGKGHFKLPGTTNVSFKQKIKYELPIIKPKKLFNLLFDEGRYRDAYDEWLQIIEEDEAKKNMEKLVEVWKKEFRLTDLKNSEIGDSNLKSIVNNIDYLDKIMDICARRESMLYIVIPPFSSMLNNQMSNEFVNIALINPLTRILECKSSVEIVDLRCDETFQNFRCYLDGGFILNRRGSIRFVNQLNDLLKLNLNNKEYGIDYIYND